MLKQTLQQKLLQKLSPQQIQFIKLLQVPTASLDARIKEELEENPALDDGSLAEMDDSPRNEYEEEEEKQKEESSEVEEEFSVEEYLQDDDLPNYSSNYNNAQDDEDKKEIPVVVQDSFYERLQSQLDLLPLSQKEYVIGQQIIGSLDDDGYLRREIPALVDDLAFSQNVMAEEEEVEKILKKIQSFEPTGIAARDLRECLLLQLYKKDQDSELVRQAITIVEDYLDEFTKKHYAKIKKQLNVTADELKDIVNEITKLNPKPGNSGNSAVSKNMHVIPDFHIKNENGELKLTLNSRNAPELRVSRSYQNMFEHYEKAEKNDKKMKEAVQFVKQKLDAAKWFIDAIKQRQQTLLKTMNTIMHYQYDYFLSGDKKMLRPMILKDIAEKIDMDISTVSRVANSKYVQTEFGTFLLKDFFSEAIQTKSGEEVSNIEVKKILEECINNEDKKKPLADEKLTQMLKKKGYSIARRTVAKYRESMNIPVARLRKEL